MAKKRSELKRVRIKMPEGKWVQRRGKKNRWDPNSQEDVDRFVALADEYFNKCDMEGTPFTVTGLALHMGMSDKSRLYELCRRDDVFADMAKEARTIVEQQCEERLCGKFNPGDLFKLKNFGWSDVTQVDVNAEVDIRIVTGVPDSEYELAKAGEDEVIELDY